MGPSVGSKNMGNRRRGSCIYIPSHDWLIVVCGTRAVSELDKISTDDIAADKAEIVSEHPGMESGFDERSDTLASDDFSVFAFNASLGNFALNSLVDSGGNNVKCGIEYVDKLVGHAENFENDLWSPVVDG